MSIKEKTINIFCLIIFITLLACPWVSAQNLVVTENTCSGAGDIKTYTVSINDAPNEVGAIGFELNYDKTKLEYQDFQKGNLTDSFLMFDVTEKDDDTLKAGGFTMSALSGGTSGTVVVINFKVLECENSDLVLGDLLDDFSGWSKTDGKLIKEAAPDLEPPMINCPADINLSTTGDSMAVNFTATATDDIDPDPEIIYDPQPGSMFSIGTTTVVAIATDASGKSSQCTFDVTIEKELVDMAPPVINCPNNMVLETINNEMPVNFTATATDDMDPNPVITYNVAPGSLFSVGTTTQVTATATDASGKSSQCSFSVTVNEVPPVDMTAPTISEVKCVVSLTVAGEDVDEGIINYEIFVNDDLDPNPAIEVNPHAGETIAIGEVIPVSVKATDASGKMSKVDFELVVNPPACPTVPTQGTGTLPSSGGTSFPSFGGTSLPSFGGTGLPSFGGTSLPSFGGTSLPSFGGTSLPSFGGTSLPSFGGTSLPSFGGSLPAFGGALPSPGGTTTFPW